MKRENKILIGLLAIIIVVLVVTYGYIGITRHAINNQEKYKIGVILPMSGHFAFYGERGLEGVMAAAANYPKIEIILEDDKGELKEAASSATKLISIDNVDALITARSSISATVAPIAEKSKVILLYSSTINFPAEENNYVFKNYVNIENDCEVLAEMLQGQKGRLIGHNLDSTTACIQGFQKHGFNLHPEFFNKGDTDFRTSLAKIKNADPDFVVVRGDKNILPLILKQMKELDLKDFTMICPHVTGAGCDVRETTELYPEYFNSAIGTTTYLIENMEDNEIYKELLPKLDKEPIDWTYALYEDVTALSIVLESCEGSTECAVKKLKSEEFKGFDSKLSFDEQGIAGRETTLVRFENGEWIPFD